MSEPGGSRILVVDDEPFMRRTIKAVLRVIDQFVIAEADNGDVALGLLAEFKPDVVLCDVAMPHMEAWNSSRSCASIPIWRCAARR